MRHGRCSFRLAAGSRPFDPHPPTTMLIWRSVFSLQRLPLAFIACLVVSGCSSNKSVCKPAADHSVVACLDGKPVLRADVKKHVVLSVHVPGKAARPDERTVALERELRVRLFAAEALRRGLEAPAGITQVRRRTVLHRKVIADEMKRLNIGPTHIDDKAARSFYTANIGTFSKMLSMSCRAIFVKDAATAEKLFKQVEAGDEAKFVALAKKSSQDSSAAEGGDIGIINRNNPNTDIELIRLSTGLRKQGAVGGPVKLSDGRFVILYVSAVHFREKPFSATQAHRAKNHMTRVRKLAALDKLFAELRGKSKVRVFASELERIPRPPKRGRIAPGKKGTVPSP